MAKGLKASGAEILNVLLKSIDDDKQDLAIKILKENPKLSNHKIGSANLSILQKSIYNGQQELFSFLIGSKQASYDVETLLHAVNANRYEMVEKLILNMRNRKLDDKCVCSASFCFDPYTTAMTLACCKNNYSIVKLLKSYGHTIEMPHRSNCACDKCRKERPKGEDIKSAEKRLTSLRSLSTRAWLFQEDCEDPLLEAIMVSHEVEKCMALEVEIKDELDELNDNLGKIVADLMSRCSNDDEIRTVLKNPVGCSTECTIQLPRLRLALDMDERDLINDRKCQNVICQEWAGTWSDWQLVPPYQRTFRILTHSLFYPLISLIYVLTLGTFPKSCRNPFARFISFASAHIAGFLTVWFNMQYREPRDQRGPPNLFMKKLLFGVLWLFVANNCLIVISDLWRLGFRRFFAMWWRWFDIAFNFWSLVTFYAFCVAWAKVKEDGISNAHRSHWANSDSTLIFEILFAPSIIMYCWRMFYYLQLNRTIGPTIISIGRCVRSLLPYLVVMVVVLLSFAIGLNYLYEHYKYNTVNRNGKPVSYPTQMSSIKLSVRHLYWAFYGYLAPENMQVVVGSSGPNETETDHPIISVAGEVLVGLFYIVIVIILLNLMVSMLTSTAAEIMEREHVEWIYICTHVRAEYFDDARSVAPPFGIFQLLINGLIFILRKITCSKNVMSVWDWRYKEREFSQDDYIKYTKLMRGLVEKVMAKEDLKVGGTVSSSKTPINAIVDKEEQHVSHAKSWVKKVLSTQ